MGYIDFEYYTETYKGSLIPEAAFERFSSKAQTKVDYYTFGHIDETAEYMNRVKYCCCELAERLYATEKQSQSSNGKDSEKVGDYTVHYSSPIESEKAQNAFTVNLINEWLSITGLLYRGNH